LLTWLCVACLGTKNDSEELVVTKKLISALQERITELNEEKTRVEVFSTFVNALVLFCLLWLLFLLLLEFNS
jgi:hypothetical protein